MGKRVRTSPMSLILGISALVLPIIVCTIIYLVKKYLLSFLDYDMWQTSYAQYSIAAASLGAIYIVLIFIRGLLRRKIPAIVFGAIEVIFHLALVVLSYVFIGYKCGFTIWLGAVATLFHFSFWEYNPLDDEFDRFDAFSMFKFFAAAAVVIGLVLVLAFLDGEPFLISSTVRIIIHIVLTVAVHGVFTVLSIIRSRDLFDGEGSDIVHGDYYLVDKYTVNELNHAITEYYNECIRAINKMTDDVYYDYQYGDVDKEGLEKYYKVKDEWVSDLKNEYDDFKSFIGRISRCKFPESMRGQKYVFDFDGLSRVMEDYKADQIGVLFLGFTRTYSYKNYSDRKAALSVKNIQAFFDGPYNDDKK